MIKNKSDSLKGLQIKVIVTIDYKFSCNINEVIRSVLNFLIFFFFLQKDFTSTKKQKTAYREQKFKNAHKNILGEKSHLFTYLRFVLLMVVFLCF